MPGLMTGWMLASAAGDGADDAGGIGVKLFQEPLLPLFGTSVDLTPFLLMFVMLAASSALLRVQSGPAWAGWALQSVGAAAWGMTVFLLGRAMLDFAAEPALNLGAWAVHLPLLNGNNAIVAGVLGLPTAGFLLLFRDVQGVRQSARLASQSCSFSAFVLGIHPCACLVRDAMYGLRFLNADNMRAFEFLAVISVVSAFTLAWGRTFCGWVCPIGFAQEMVTKLTAPFWQTADRAPAGGRTRAVRWAVAMLLLAGFVFGYLLPDRNDTPLYQGMLMWWVLGLLVFTLLVTGDPRMEKRLRPLRYASLILFAGTIWLGAYLNGVFCVLLKNILAKPTVLLFAGVLLTTLVLSQAWCRFLCPEGALLGLLTRLSGLKVTLAPARCTGCNVCRDVCPVEAIEVGRVEESICLYCAKCIDQCPTDALTMEGDAPKRGVIPLPMARVGTA